MCGLCGEVRWDGPADVEAVHKMTGLLRRRGPDAGGVHAQDGIALGHRRLGILDLSAASQQPMIDPELGLAAVFNGCIYNFRALRAELQALGYRFFSAGDTEVILKAHHAWGPRCVERFHGMFAYALWERDNGRLVLARDRLGIKPLYLVDLPNRLRFASTLPALLAAGGVDTAIDPVALHHYMSWHAVVPAPRTILKGVRKLPPATLLMVAADGSRTEDRYWTLPAGAREDDRGRAEQDWCDAVLETLSQAVDKRRVADVPVGVLLSGGLDSSLLVALLPRMGQSGVKTFSVGFDAVKGLEGDEFRYSDLIARRFETDHTRIRVGAEETLAALPDVVASMSEPMMSHDAVGFHLLSREVSKHVRVVQSGQGADEVFGGYHWYPKLTGSTDLVADYARLYFDRDQAEMERSLAPHLLGEDHSRRFVAQFFEASPAPGAIDKVLHLDTEIMLVDDPVKRVDNMTMAFGLEARVPFLDHDLVELAARIPAGLKVGRGGKHVLKQASRRLLPAEAIDRPKGYFPVPALKFIQGRFLAFVREVLASPTARGRRLFNQAYVDGLLADPDRALTPKGHSKLWQVALLELWFQSHGI